MGFYPPLKIIFVVVGITYDNKLSITRVYIQARQVAEPSSDGPSPLDEPSSFDAPSLDEPSSGACSPQYALHDHLSSQPPDRYGFAGAILSELTS